MRAVACYGEPWQRRAAWKIIKREGSEGDLAYILINFPEARGYVWPIYVAQATARTLSYVFGEVLNLRWRIARRLIEIHAADSTVRECVAKCSANSKAYRLLVGTLRDRADEQKRLHPPERSIASVIAEIRKLDMTYSSMSSELMAVA